MFYRKKEKNIPKLIIASLTGLASGTILGLLFAPNKGSSIRKKILKKSDNYLRGIKKDIDEFRVFLSDRAEATKNEINELNRDFQEKGEDILKNAQKMTSYEQWTKEELYERAKKKNIDGYSQMSKGELIKALRRS